jgi:hypothetical protein
VPRTSPRADPGERAQRRPDRRALRETKIHQAPAAEALAGFIEADNFGALVVPQVGEPQHALGLTRRGAKKHVGRNRGRQAEFVVAVT